MFLKIAKYFPHIIVLPRTYCKTFDAIVIVVFDYFIRFCGIAEIVFIENDQLLFLTFLDDEIELGIATAVGYSCISYLHKNIDFMCILLDQSECSFHVAWKPVEVVLQCIYHLHTTIFQPIIILYFKMNTPKYSGNYIRNALSPSPLRNNPKGRYFSSDEVAKMIKTSFEPKIQYLVQQLEQRQQIIAHLNNKLNENDQRLKQQSSLIESFIKKQRDSGHMQSYIVGTINQLINDKTKQAWEMISAQLKQIAVKAKAQVDPKRIQANAQVQIQKMKQTVKQFIDLHKKKSNNYWQKIKQALNKINNKIVSTEKDLMDINVKIENFQQQRNRDRETILELQNSKNVVKNMIQLKKSVDNIYENYQSILNLQKSLRQRLEDQHGQSLWHQPDFFKTNSKLLLGGEQMIALQYSKEEIMGERAVFEEWKPYENTTQPILSPMKISQQQDKSSSDLFQLQKTSPIRGHEHSEIFSLNNSNQMNSKIHNSTFLLNHSLQTRKQMCNEVRQRLLELIQIKNLRKPLEVRLDQQINCLKTAEGNYLFDAKGNMFKLKMPDLIKLEQEGILTRNRPKKTSLSNSKIKKTNC